MYGTIMRAQTKPGQRNAFVEMMKQRGTPDRNPGFVCAEIAVEDKDPNGVIAVIHFRDRDSYVSNAQRPEVDGEYQRMLEHLASPPEWTDVEYVAYTGEPLSESSMAAAG
ncbi:MAG TPA: antibiotic biosynthesis monooxygenase [Candidatus Dormibacteraeota bacterium]|jgi:quinol monooxygenase YgiN|nr:antibiotic biosynthesis monooxygenase [Candidatus Dormibacteraeota bacterium]